MFEPPPGTDDLDSQALDIILPDRHHTVVVGGLTLHVRKPRPEALQAFAMAVSKYTPTETQNNMVSLFVQQHTTKDSYDDLMQSMMDPDGTFTMDDLGTLMKEIATAGTARPTVP
jgi:hypothetical protein